MVVDIHKCKNSNYFDKYITIKKKYYFCGVSETIYKIERGIKPPIKRVHKTRKYPFAEMKVGDSFVVPIESRQNLCVSSISYSKNHQSGKWKFSIRKISEVEVRCWRVK